MWEGSGGNASGVRRSNARPRVSHLGLTARWRVPTAQAQKIRDDRAMTDHEPTSPRVVASTPVLGGEDDARIRGEISSVLESDQTVLGEVFRGIQSGLTDDEIRKARGNETPNFVWNYKRTIKALLDG